MCFTTCRQGHPNAGRARGLRSTAAARLIVPRFGIRVQRGTRQAGQEIRSGLEHRACIGKRSIS